MFCAEQPFNDPFGYLGGVVGLARTQAKEK